MSIELLAVAALAASLASLLVSILVLAGIRSLAAAERDRGLSEALSALEKGHDRLVRGLADDLARARSETGEAGRNLREEIGKVFSALSDGVIRQVGDTAHLHREQSRQDHEALVGAMKEVRDLTVQHLGGMKTDAANGSKALSESVTAALNTFGETTRQQSRQLFDIQKTQHDSFEARLAALGEAHGKASEALRQALDGQLKVLRDENTAKLEQMRATVDEKLQGTLEQRLGESFKVVSDRLEAVHKGLGEMQTLATGVGDLKRVLTNVKARGSWGEVQLGALLEQTLTPGQYVRNAVMAASGQERVEFAVALPGEGEGQEVYLPIDAKFPIEDYERLQAAAEIGDVEAVEASSRALELRFRASARDISTKYIHPPRTTDFAIMFLPTEGLYAEAIRRPGLVDDLQRTQRVVIAGPTTLTAVLNSLQMGFRTLAIQKRSSEVWQVLGAVKTEFGKFGPVLEKVKKKLQEASNHIESAEQRSRAIGRQLRDVQELPAPEETVALIGTIEEELGLEDERGTTVNSRYFDEAERAS